MSNIDTPKIKPTQITNKMSNIDPPLVAFEEQQFPITYQVLETLTLGTFRFVIETQVPSWSWSYGT